MWFLECIPIFSIILIRELIYEVMILAKISQHTKLTNAMVGFSKGGPEWPSPLKEAGYDLDTIEARIAYQGGKINPDVIFASNSELHAIITECKSGTLSQDTIDEYEKIKSEDKHNGKRGDE